jgi:hypothetical protein
MELDLLAMYEFVVTELAAERSVRESMDRVIAECAKGHPHEDWEKLRALPYEDLDHLRKWVVTPFRLDPPQCALAGLWFGLFQPIYMEKVVADIYVCGSTRFDPNPLDNSWAGDPEWVPEHRNARSTVLAQIYEIAYREDGMGNDLGNDAEYPLCLAYGGLAVRDLLRAIDPSIFLGSSPSLGIAVGYDSGDSVLVGMLSRTGLAAVS